MTYAILAENSIGDTRLWLTSEDAGVINEEWDRCIAATQFYGGIFIEQRGLHDVTFIFDIGICRWYTINSNEYPPVIELPE